MKVAIRSVLVVAFGLSWSTTGVGQAAVLPVGGARLWLETENGEGTAYNSSAGIVTTWLDQSGNDIDMFVQVGHESRRPSLTAPIAAINNHLAIRFNDSDYLYNNTASRVFPIGTTVSTIFAVFAVETLSGVRAVFDTEGDNTTNRFLLATNGSALLVARDGSGGSMTSPALSAVTYYYATALLNGASSFLQENGEDQVTGTITTTPVANGNDTILGARFARDQYFLGGDLVELIIYNSALSSENIGLVEEYLADKYFPVAEPSSTLLMSIGACGLLRRRRS
jgi:hypothetical protein